MADRTPIAAMVAQMLSTGIPPETILLAIEAVERSNAEIARSGVPVDSAAERRRAWDRERKRRASTGIPPEGQNRPSLLTTDSNSESQKVEKKKEQIETNSTGIPPEIHRNGKGQKLPEDWKANQKHYDEGAELGLSEGQIEAMAINMRLWARANEHRAVARKSSWDLTFSGWMRREASKLKPNGAPPRGSDRENRSVGQAARELADLGLDFGAKPSVVPNEKGGAVVRLLPERRSG